MRTVLEKIFGFDFCGAWSDYATHLTIAIFHFSGMVMIFRRYFLSMPMALSVASTRAFVRAPITFVRQNSSAKELFFPRAVGPSSRASTKSSDERETQTPSDPVLVPIYKCEGLFAVEKPLEWTSNDVVCYIRGILERDARGRGATVVGARSRKNKNQKVKVGHGGTLDPLATGVLVIGVGKGTKELQE